MNKPTIRQVAARNDFRFSIDVCGTRSQPGQTASTPASFAARTASVISHLSPLPQRPQPDRYFQRARCPSRPCALQRDRSTDPQRSHPRLFAPASAWTCSYSRKLTTHAASAVDRLTVFPRESKLLILGGSDKPRRAAHIMDRDKVRAGVPIDLCDPREEMAQVLKERHGRLQGRVSCLRTSPPGSTRNNSKVKGPGIIPPITASLPISSFNNSNASQTSLIRP